jgi:hypothetical protein
MENTFLRPASALPARSIAPRQPQPSRQPPALGRSEASHDGAARPPPSVPMVLAVRA